MRRMKNTYTDSLYLWVKRRKDFYNIKKNIQDNDGQMIYDYPEVDEFRMYKRYPNKVYDKLENDMCWNQPAGVL